MQSPVFLGIDLGTQSCRCGMYAADGTLISIASAAYLINCPRPGWAEQSPDDWWNALVQTVRECMAKSGVDPARVHAIALDNASATVVFTDAEGRPLRPAIMWMDVRAHAQAARITATDDACLKYAGGTESAEFVIPKALWVKENEPDVYIKTRRICESLDWLVWRLTGDWAGSLANATCKWNFAAPEGGAPRRLLETLGASELLGLWPDRMLPVGSPVGTLRPAVAAELGLAPATTVVTGLIDAYAGMLGVGVSRPGRVALITGSSTCHLAISDKPLFGCREWGPYPDVLPGTWIIEGGQASTGSVVRWFVDQFASGPGALQELEAAAATILPGCDGLTMLDSFQGNRSPLRDPMARGAVWGLSLNHTPAHLLRAIYESTVFGTRFILEDMQQVGLSATGLYACGGGTKSRLWMQMYADICGIPVFLPDQPEAVSLGAAMCAAVGAGVYKDFSEASDAMVRYGGTIEPDLSRRARYEESYSRYLATYDSLLPLMHAASK